ncbi:hypothetical protein ACFFJY_01050 [Fictibacillus aquaticus]|uniref:Uncharacterized protein n=1 Tax=Fictibacillus aquaticus TaxID=2021314 RepID=A0A235F7L7_9BACL|nr:hypothetical protein [Fictibacillus aquaticus]OYD57310.1 hypothetical protein CGZ90_11525 [Fictibacillus aquaticus]
MNIVKSIFDNIEYIAAFLFLVFFLANKKARTNFAYFMKEHKKQVLLFLLLIGLPFAVVTIMIFVQ